MNYSVDEAIEYSKNNELEKWVQLFLRDNNYVNANANLPLADGLLLEDRFYIGPILIDLDIIVPIRIDENISDKNDLKYFYKVVDRISKDYKNYNLPPFIVEYKKGKLYLTDGNHRYSALKKLNVNKYYVIVWGNKIDENEAKEYLNR